MHSSISFLISTILFLFFSVVSVLADVTEAQQNLVEIHSSLEDVVGQLEGFAPTKTWNVDQAQNVGDALRVLSDRTFSAIAPLITCVQASGRISEAEALPFAIHVQNSYIPSLQVMASHLTNIRDNFKDTTLLPVGTGGLQHPYGAGSSQSRLVMVGSRRYSNSDDVKYGIKEQLLAFRANSTAYFGALLDSAPLTMLPAAKALVHVVNETIEGIVQGYAP